MFFIINLIKAKKCFTYDKLNSTMIHNGGENMLDIRATGICWNMKIEPSITCLLLPTT